MKTKDLLKEIEEEILKEKNTLITKAIQDELKTFIFDEKNISPSLITTLMAAQKSAKLPVPEPAELPQTEGGEVEDVLDFINVNISSIFSDLLVGNNVYLFGKAGSGKTTLAKKIADRLLKRPSYTINCNQFTSPTQIIGGQTIDGYKEGNLVKAWREGGVLILDELPKLDPNTAGLLNEALASSADRERIEKIATKEEYEKLKSQLEQDKKNDTYSGFDVMEKDGKYWKVTHVTITDGKGEKVKKHKNFCCIGTGNTDMKTPSTNFTGNNRQDYSLVDRFAGSFYKIDYDVTTEKMLCYDKVYKISMILRDFLTQDEQAVEFVSLRTMLNFNRIYEQEMLREIESPFANPAIIVEEKKGDEPFKTIISGKTFADAVGSFIDMIPSEKRALLKKQTRIDDEIQSTTPAQVFIEEFIRLHKVNPITKEVIIEKKKEDSKDEEKKIGFVKFND
jgi:cobaltochelatase CobS